MDGITFNGTHNNSIDGLTYVSSSRFIVPENRDTYIDIPHRDSSILIPDNSKKDIEIVVNFTLESTNTNDLFRKFLLIKEWLNTTNRAPLIFDDTPSLYWNGKAYTRTIFEQLDEFDEIADFSVSFRCEPHPKLVEE